MLATCVIALTLAFASQPAERIAEISVHGNALTSDDEIIRLAQVSVGMAVDDQLTEQVADRLRATGRFERVEVLKRFASIVDASQIVLVIVVDDGPVRIQPGQNGAEARVVKARGSQLMFLPILGYEDGYGLSYGVRFTIPDALGRRTRLSVPLTWGGEKRAAVEIERSLSTLFTRVQAGAGISRREHPYFETNDDRRALWVRGERAAGAFVRAGVNAAFERVSFGGTRDHLMRAGADVVVDTRTDPFLARNAVYARAAWDRLSFRDAAGAHRTALEARGYIGLRGQAVLILRAVRQDSDRPLPPYLMPTLGGTENLRGFRAGTAVGDTLVSTSAELRVPLSSPLSVGKVGVSAFIDAATVYGKSERLRDQELRRGLGGGVWFSATVLRLSLAVAHGVGGSTRLHLATTVTF